MCTLLKSNVLWELRYTKQIAQAIDVLPAWKVPAKKDRPYNDRGNDRNGGGGQDHTSSYDTNVHDKVNDLMKPYWAAFPILRVSQICTAAGIDFRQLPESFKGICYNKFLGRCTRSNCSHSHDFSGVPDEDVATFCTLLAPGVKKIVAVQALCRRRAVKEEFKGVRRGVVMLQAVARGRSEVAGESLESGFTGSRCP